jgi:hypothetical protein
MSAVVGYVKELNGEYFAKLPNGFLDSRVLDEKIVLHEHISTVAVIYRKIEDSELSGMHL